MFGDASHVNVLRINGMVQHYRMHKRTDRNLGFLTFLRMHYLDSHGNAANDRQHSKLPFKSKHETGSVGMLCYVVPDSRVSVSHDHHPVAAPAHAEYIAVLHRGFPISLFHPPSLS